MGEGTDEKVSEDVVAPQVRNLTYMVTRREKMKRSLWKVQEQIFQHQVRLLDHELLSGQSHRPFQVSGKISWF